LKWLKKNYDFSKVAFSIDELIVLNVTRGEEVNKDGFCDHVKALTEECFVPIAAGGGIRSVDQARKLLRSGADKVVVNTLLKIFPERVEEISAEFGCQCVVASVDIKNSGEQNGVFIKNGTQKLNISADEWLDKVSKMSVGEIYLNSIDRDGTGQGYLKKLLKLLPDTVQIPVILAGGAGQYNHLAEGLLDDRVDAVATAHLFNFVGNGLELARIKLLKQGFNLAAWDVERVRLLKNSLNNLTEQ